MCYERTVKQGKEGEYWVDVRRCVGAAVWWVGRQQSMGTEAAGAQVTQAIVRTLRFLLCRRQSLKHGAQWNEAVWLPCGWTSRREPGGQSGWEPGFRRRGHRQAPLADSCGFRVRETG